jgi:hypothetical protein
MYDQLRFLERELSRCIADNRLQDFPAGKSASN